MGKTPEAADIIFFIIVLIGVTGAQEDYGCPPQEKIAPCRCSSRDMDYQIWCSHSELPKVLEGLTAVSRYISRPVDELILENNNLPSLPGKVFTSLRVLRLMLRNNHLERVSSGWLEGLHDSLLELFLVEPDLRSLPIDSLDNLQGLEAITLQSNSMKRLPRFTGLSKLRYLQVNSRALTELSPSNFRDLPNLEQLHIFGSPHLVRLEAGLFRSLPKLSLINITDCGITWIHPRAFVDLPDLNEISLVGNKIPDAAIVGRVIVDLPRLSTVRLDANRITRLQEESFVDIPSLSRLSLSQNLISEIFAGAFQLLPQLRVLDLDNNIINRIHPEFFVQRTGSGLEELRITKNRLNHVNELRSILGALPRLKLLDASYNYLEEIPFGALRGHPTLERLHLDHNRITFLQRETFSAMPALRELRLKNNSLTNLLEAPFWNLPGLKGLDLSDNYLRHVEPILLANLPNLRRLDLSGNGIALVEPDSFLGTPGLEHLNLSRNAIAMIHPMTLGPLTALYELDVGWNRLLEVVPGLPKNIEHLHLPMNRIILLPAAETRDLALPALRSLDLSANGIERIPAGSLRELPSLRKLLLGYNSLRVLEDGTFDGLVRLEQLDLKYNRLMSIHGRSLMPLRSLMDLNLRGNRLEVIRPDIFMENVLLQRLDLGRNNLAQIPHATFANTRDLRELSAPHNTLTELPGSLHGLAALEVLDLSFNKLNILSPDTLSSLNSLLELRLVRNKIEELREGAFNRLPRLSFIDLENNDLRIIERNSIRNLPELQAIRLGKNRIQMIPSGAFTDLPLLQSAELQENRIQEIASNAFINVPNILYLNLSNNLLPSLEHAGLSALRSLEVLDISNNRLTRVATESLRDLEWLVELKMDNNRICGIQGIPFDNMSRLRVLSMRKNRMTSVPESAFKRLRSNIAVLDIDGNPLSCSCGMIWLRGWLQQGSSEGPRCADGTLFREMRLSRQDCAQRRQVESFHPGCEAEMIDQVGGSSFTGEKNPSSAWTNFHKPSKHSQTPEDYMYEDYPDYHFDNFTDQAASEDMTKSSTSSPTSVTATIQTGPIDFTRPPSASPNSLTNDRLGPPPKKKHPPIPPSPSSSGFTFFGVPLPNLNFNLWSNSGKKSTRKEDSRPTRGRYRTFPPSEPEVHRGGFHPIPPPNGGFVPIANPIMKNDDRLESSKSTEKFKNSPEKPKNFGEKSKNPFENQKNSSESWKNSDDKMKNSTSFKLPSRSATVTRVFRKKPTKPETTSGRPDREEMTTTEIVKILPSTTSMSLKIPDKFNKSISISTEIYNAENLHDSSEESSNDKTASKIVWTTSGMPPTSAISTTLENNLHTAETEGIYQARNKHNLFEDHTSLVKPEETSPMTPDEPLIFVTTQKFEGELMTEGNIKLTTQNSKTMEASALSAFLVPGGQVGTAPQLVARASGRSTIEKVASPHLANQTRSGKVEENPGIEESARVEETKPSIDDDPFNWYFQNYNESNLEPFIGVVYSSGERILPNVFILTAVKLILSIF